MHGIYYLTSAYAPSTNHSRIKSKKQTSELVNQILEEEKGIEEQIYFEVLYVSCIKFTS